MKNESNEVLSKQEFANKSLYATQQAKKVLKKGDKIRVKPSRCNSRKVTITFSHFDNNGQWIVSISGGDEYHAMYVDKLNGVPINFLD